MHHALERDLHPHGHAFAELSLVTDGAVIEEAPDGSHPLAVGMVLVVPIGAWHAFRAVQGVMLFDCCLGQPLLRGELGWLAHDRHLAPLHAALLGEAPTPGPLQLPAPAAAT
ncbi:MAG: AraC family ligand binding domain-containing protein, partial [Planctomycetes bacterium]|nr:AraC family ligand binding domain-containing protein [Planctomycetota bacterium]